MAEYQEEFSAINDGNEKTIVRTKGFLQM